jgi:hypothetical protein
MQRSGSRCLASDSGSTMNKTIGPLRIGDALITVDLPQDFLPGAALPATSTRLTPGTDSRNLFRGFCILSRDRERHTLRQATLSILDCLSQLFLNLRSEAPHGAQPSLVEHTLQSVESANIQVGEQRPDTRRPIRNNAAAE